LTQRFLHENIHRFTEDTASNCDFKVLDVGCGQRPYEGYFVHPQLYIGVDISSKVADIIATAENLPFGNSYFDVVLCMQVLEHVEEPKKVLEEIKRVLRKEGVLILSTHGFWTEAHESTDYWRWTMQGLQKAIESAGFRVVEVSSMEPVSSMFQTLLLWVPYKLSLFYALVNFAGLSLKKLLKKKGPRLNIVHVVRARG